MMMIMIMMMMMMIIIIIIIIIINSSVIYFQDHSRVLGRRWAINCVSELTLKVSTGAVYSYATKSA